MIDRRTRLQRMDQGVYGGGLDGHQQLYSSVSPYCTQHRAPARAQLPILLHQRRSSITDSSFEQGGFVSTISLIHFDTLRRSVQTRAERHGIDIIRYAGFSTS